MDSIGDGPIVSIIYTVTIGTMLNNNGCNNGHGLITLQVNRTLLWQQREVEKYWGMGERRCTLFFGGGGGQSTVNWRPVVGTRYISCILS